MSKPLLISSVLTLMFAQDLNITDNTDLMRANILGSFNIFHTIIMNTNHYK